MIATIETLRWQFELVWKLVPHVLHPLDDVACLWEPAPGAWSVRRGEDGGWRPDFANPEPDPIPTTSIAWIIWHLDWWWRSVLAEIEGKPRVRREDCFWPGSAAASVAALEELADRWRAMLTELDDAALDREIAGPWPNPLAHTVAWAHVELMKNLAEIGVVLRDYRASV